MKRLEETLSFQRKIERLAKKTRQQYLNSIKSLAIALEARDSYTQGHSLRVTHYSLATAEQLSLSKRNRKKLHLAGLLHDIGKIGVKEEVLSNPNKLTSEQYEQIKMHPLLSVKILRPTISDEDIIKIIKHHHEYWDGSGYPDGLKGENIPLGARIMLVCDTFDSMTSNRPYRKAQSFKMALNELKKMSKAQFDPEIIEAFFNIPEEKLKKIQKLPFRSLLNDLYSEREEEKDIFFDVFLA